MNPNISSASIIALLLGTGLASFTTHAQAVEHHHAVATPLSPYAGEQTRDIKALSKTDVSNLMGGAGAGYAKAVELNGYPGPMHVLELARRLRLTDEQRAASEKLLKDHKQEARDIGAMIVATERQLDVSFAKKNITVERLSALTREIATLQASLRNSHLQAHLRQTALLRPEQVSAYQTLRGYGVDTLPRHSTH